MKIERLVCSCVAVASALGLAVSAKAEIVTVTYQGTVASGSDGVGVFGAAGADLVGDSFTAVYTVNDTLSPVAANDPGQLSLSEGGSELGDGATVSATVTIKGVTVQIDGSYFSEAFQSTINYGVAQVYEKATSGTASGESVDSSIYSYSDPWLANSDYHAPFSYTVQPGVSAYGTFYDSGSGSTTNLSLVPTSVTIADAVPESATWAMLILGLGMIGFAARRRNAAVALAA